MTKRTYLCSLLSLLLLVFLFSSPPAAAQQCTDPSCLGGGNGPGPEISISPDEGTWQIDSGTSTAIAVTIGFSDSDGLVQSSMSLSVRSGTTTTPVTGFSWTPNSAGTFALVKGTLRLSLGGIHTFSATISDRGGNSSTRSVDYTVEIIDPTLPKVSTAPHHGEYRNTTLGAATHAYALPPYISFGAARTVGIRYDSEQADPTGFVQLDVSPDPASGSQVVAMSLQIFDAATGAAVTSQDVWAKDPSGLPQRVGARWSMRDRPTGAYMFYADVKSWWSDRTTFKVRRVPVRVLVINERNSKYGAGWSLDGVQRIHSAAPMTDDGLLLNEGNGVARWFAKNGTCSASECNYRTPSGDFSRLVYNAVTGQWTRTYPNGTTVTFSNRGYMTTVADRFGRTTRYVWQNTPEMQPTSILTSVTDPAGKVTTLGYHWGISLAEIADPAGRRATFSYTNADLTSIAGPVNLNLTYDAQHRITGYTNWRGSWNLAYDDRGTVSQSTAPAVTASGQSIRPVTSFKSIQTVTTLPPNLTSICCNWAAHVPASAAYATVTDPLAHITKVAADRYGNPVQLVDALGTVTGESRYTDDGLPSVVTVNGVTSTYEWNARGQLISRTMAGAVVYHASYTPEGWLEFESAGGSATWFSYGTRGQVLLSWYGKKEDSYKNSSTYTYDDQYRLVAAVGPKGERLEWSYAGNPWGNVSEMRLIRDDGTRLVTATMYDGAGRARTVTNPLNHTTTTSYDALNRITSVVDALGRTASYAYTGPYLTTVTDTANKVYRFTYNALGWLESETFPGSTAVRTYQYNADGMLVSSADRRGASFTVANKYDAAHRLTEVIADGITTFYSYPDTATVVMWNNDAKETVRFNREAGQIQSVTTTIGGPESTNAYEVERIFDYETGWTPKGFHVKRYQYGSLVRTDTVSYTRDFFPVDTTLGSALSIQDFSGLTTTLGFDTSGRHARTVYPAGVTQSKSYTTDGRLQSVMFSNSWVHDNIGATYGYDLLNRTISRTSGDGRTIRTYGYDSVGQLIDTMTQQRMLSTNCNPSYEICEEEWVVTGMKGYTYDAAGNRTDSGATLQANSNRYATFGGFALEYDGEGNLKRKWKSGFDQRLTWDSHGQLRSVTTNGSTVAYGYAPSGKRVWRTQNGQTVFFIYHGDDLVMEVDGSGNPLRAYTHLPGTDLPLSVRVTSSGQNATYYYTMENPGHVTGLLNTSGGLAAQHKYEPFGAAELASDPTGQPLRFMARELDQATGFYYVRARWYDPALGRFISEDPIGLAGGPNTYTYVGNDPINSRDPSGLCPPPCSPGSEGNPIKLPPIDATINSDGSITIRGFDANALWRIFSTGYGPNDIGTSAGLGRPGRRSGRPESPSGSRPSGDPAAPVDEGAAQCREALADLAWSAGMDLVSLVGPLKIAGAIGRLVMPKVVARFSPLAHELGVKAVELQFDGAIRVMEGAHENHAAGDHRYGLKDALVDALPGVNTGEAFLELWNDCK